MVYKPRSIRNNNPFSLEYDEANPIKWEGLATPPSDGEYDSNGNLPQAVFTSMYYGIRAGVDNLLHQIGKGLDTPTKLFAVYAPAANGNDPVAYAKSVADDLGITPDTPFTLPGQLPGLAAAVVKMETGWSLSRLEEPSIITAAIQSGQDQAEA